MNDGIAYLFAFLFVGFVVVFMGKLYIMMFRRNRAVKAMNRASAVYFDEYKVALDHLERNPTDLAARQKVLEVGRQLFGAHLPAEAVEVRINGDINVRIGKR